MKMRFLLPALILAAALPACDRSPTASSTPIPEPTARTKTIETTKLAMAIDRYEQEPTTAHGADVKKAQADLEGEIAELQGRVSRTNGNDRDEAAAKLRNLETYRDTQASRFMVLEAKKSVSPSHVSEPDARSGAEKIEDRTKSVGDRVEDGAKRTGDAIKEAGHDVKDAVKDVVQ